MDIIQVAALFVRTDSIYKTIDGVDVYDIDRDARTFQRGIPVVAHPPCRLWGRLRQFSTAPYDEKALALWAVDTVRVNGGVLEHPAHSTLWTAKNLLQPGTGMDEYEGYTLSIDQHWFGHPAQKSTWLYIVGANASELPVYTLNLSRIDYVIKTTKLNSPKIITSKKWRDSTPYELAMWLVEIARLTWNNRQ